MIESFIELKLTENNRYKILLESINEIVWTANLTTNKFEIIGKRSDTSAYNNTELTSLIDYAE